MWHTKFQHFNKKLFHLKNGPFVNLIKSSYNTKCVSLYFIIFHFLSAVMMLRARIGYQGRLVLYGDNSTIYMRAVMPLIKRPVTNLQRTIGRVQAGPSLPRGSRRFRRFIASFSPNKNWTSTRLGARLMSRSCDMRQGHGSCTAIPYCRGKCARGIPNDSPAPEHKAHLTQMSGLGYSIVGIRR